MSRAQSRTCPARPKVEKSTSWVDWLGRASIPELSLTQRYERFIRNVNKPLVYDGEFTLWVEI